MSASPNIVEDIRLDRHVLLIRQRYPFTHHIGAALVVLCWALNTLGALHDPRLSVAVLLLLFPALLLMLPWWGQGSRWQARLEVSDQRISAAWRGGLLARERSASVPTAGVDAQLWTQRGDTLLFLPGISIRGLVTSSEEAAHIKSVLDGAVARAGARVGDGAAEVPAALRGLQGEGLGHRS